MKDGASLVGRSALPPSPKVHPGTLAPTFFRIPEIDGANPATFTGKVDHTSLLSCPDSISNRKFVVGAVLEMNNNPLELNRPALNPELEGSKTLATVHGDRVVIVPAVHMRLPKHFPSIFVVPGSLTGGVSAGSALSEEVH
jgi:hypothetical protein